MDEQLQHAIEEVQRYPPGSEERESALNRLVEQVLKSRKICRCHPGQSLRGIYQTVYLRLKECVARELQAAIDTCAPEVSSVRQWASERLEQVYRDAIDNDLLKSLAIEVQNQPPDTELRRYGLRELVEAIRVSGRLCRPHLGQWNSQFYELVYEEAVNQTLVYVCQKIHLYAPDRGNGKFMNWINFQLDKKFLDIARQFRHNSTLPNLSDLDAIAAPEEPPSIANCIQKTLESNPDRCFTQTHIRGNPQANFQRIAFARLFDKSWQEISDDLEGIPIPTLSAFFRRSCQKFSHFFKDCR